MSLAARHTDGSASSVRASLDLAILFAKSRATAKLEHSDSAETVLNKAAEALIRGLFYGQSRRTAASCLRSEPVMSRLRELLFVGSPSPESVIEIRDALDSANLTPVC